MRQNPQITPGQVRTGMKWLIRTFAFISGFTIARLTQDVSYRGLIMTVSLVVVIVICALLGYVSQQIQRRMLRAQVVAILNEIKRRDES